jgi:ATP-dependent DNA helicase RecG
MATKSKFDPRQLMEKTIEVMRLSVNEPRDGGDVPPKVGAVLWKPDGTVETACRGELRYGDHAEFTLLERKNRSSRLDGSILFATLEPCGPEARNKPKLGCAERIVNARIKEVWVGVLDPHPKVAGKGLEFLKHHRIVVHVFDRDLQEVIKGENKQFFAQAELKAEEAEHKEEIVLSEYEKAAPQVAIGDLSSEALRSYQSFLGFAGAVNSAPFRRRLQQQGLLEEVNGTLVPTGFGTILFGKHPRDTVPEAVVLGTIHYLDGREEVRDFEGPMVNVPAEVIQWLKDKLPNPIERSGARRKDANEKFFELVRESIVNAIVHRDYAVKGAKCQVVVTPDTIIVKSPGRPIEPITLEQLQSFSAPMVSRNPMLHVVFGKMELAEERGLGLKSMKARATEAGLPLPTYRWEDPYLVLTLYRSAASAGRTLAAETFSSLSKAERAGWQWLATQETITSHAYAEAMKIAYRTAMNHLQKFQKAGLIEKVGAGPATEYKIRRP